MKKSTAKKDSERCEYLSKDILEEDFLDMFMNFLTFQKLLSVSRVEARDRFVSQLTLRHKFYTLMQASAVVVAFTATYFVYVGTYYPYSELNSLFVAGYIKTLMTYCSFVFHARFRDNKANVIFYIKAQKIDRLMGVEYNQSVNHMLRRVNKTAMIFLLSLFSILLLLSCFGGLLMVIVYMSVAACFGAATLDLTYSSNLLVYFFIRLRFINSVMLNHIEGISSSQKPHSLKGPSKKVFRYLAAQSHEFQTSNTDEHLRRLLECFTVYEKLHEIPIFIHFVVLFTFCITFVVFAIYSLSRNLFTYYEWIIVSTFVGLTLIQTLTNIYRLETFFREVKETKKLSLRVMSQCWEGPLREKAKRMYNLLHMLPPRFSVCDLWYLDAIFLISFINTISTSVMNLLQFYF